MKEAEERYTLTIILDARTASIMFLPCFFFAPQNSHWNRYKTGQNHLTDFIGVEPSKKRKRRTSFTPQALELLNAHFERNTHPSGTNLGG